MRKPKTNKPSVFRDLIAIWMEQRNTQKALRQAAQLDWSIEFLTAMLYKAAKHYGTNLELELKNKSGNAIIIRTADGKPSEVYKEDDIFEHLDDERRIAEFLDKVQR